MVFNYFQVMTKSFSLLFANDIVLVSSTPSGLQNQINSLEKASKSLGLTVNLDKTKVMFFRKGGHISATEKWFLCGKEIEIVNRHKYLGVHSNNETVKCLCLRRFCQQGQRKSFRLDEDNVVSRKFRHHCILSAF